MDCHRRQALIEEFRRTHFKVEEELRESSVKIAMECLQISDQNPSPMAATDHSSDTKFGDDCKTDDQNDGQNIEMSENTTHSVPKHHTNETNEEQVVDGYSSDSVYDSSSETEYGSYMSPENKSEICGQSGDVIEDRKKSLNAVIKPERPLTTRYPLKYKWQLWFWRADHGVKVVWEQALQKVCKPFDTVEDFWRLYHHIIPVRQLGIRFILSSLS